MFNYGKERERMFTQLWKSTNLPLFTSARCVSSHLCHCFPALFYIKECVESFQTPKQENAKNKEEKERREGGEGFHSCR